MSAEYSEDILVQKTTAKKLHTLGWTPIFAYNHENFGADSLLGRTNDRDILLKRSLRKALTRLNSGHPESAYEDAIAQLQQASVTKTARQHNQDKYELIRDGISVKYTDESDRPTTQRLRLIDYDNPNNNEFLAIRELWIQGQTYRRRPDILGYVNGIPLVFIELKRSNKDIRLAYNNNLRDYLDTIPELFHYNAIVLLSNGISGKVGSFTSPYNFFHEWKRLEEGEPGRVGWETMLLGLCTPANLLDLVQNFILFDQTSQPTAKILARNHQYLGVNRTFAAVRDRLESPNPDKLGVFWHTQGSGKSYSMAFLGQKVHRLLRGSYTFVIVTDREDLDNQIAGTFANLGANTDKTQASSGAHLTQLLRENHHYVFTLIHKFNQPGTVYSERNDIIVICDEAHRTQYGLLADNMRAGLPNAAFIAFTGTPLMNSPEDQKTRQTFGDYISTYNFQRAIEDGATVPLYYDNRGEKLTFEYNGEITSVSNDEAFNCKIAEELEQYGLDADDEASIRRRLGNDYIILTASDRLDRIAEDLVAHYLQRWQTGKAMLVCLDKVTAVRMHGLIDKYWKQAIAQQQQQLKQVQDEQEATEQQKYLDWLRESEYLVVISESQNEVATFREWDIDIEPHRQAIKTRSIDNEFRDPDHPFRLAIVCAMWLTGFDVKTLSTLYIDKPMQGHNLMQAIARANRVAEGKCNGLLVDYNGLLKSLRAALSKYAQGEAPVSEVPDGETDTEDSSLYPDIETELKQSYERAIDNCIRHVNGLGCDLQQLIDATGFDKLAQLDENHDGSVLNAICSSDESRAEFNVLARQVFQIKESLSGYAEIARPYDKPYRAIDALYKQLHQRREANIDLNHVLFELQQSIGDSIRVEREREAGADSGQLYDISSINWDLLKTEFERSPRKNLKVQDLKTAIEHQLDRMLQGNRSQKRLDLYNRYQQIILDYNRETDRVAIEQTFEALIALVQDISEEDSRAIREGLDNEYLAIFDLLCDQKQDLNQQAIARVKAVARELLDLVQQRLSEIEGWSQKDQTQDEVRRLIYDRLYNEETGLPEDDYAEDEIEHYANVIFLHIREQYGAA
ncbi:type I restriction endonuclease subunit R [Sodalinema gerasimenkoae]|uniref:type I restriction endonuclease subunit R n=1 Tax=Sodalinema gerasimenkoae TaxID=2862348 RepID=UPI00135BF50B|nr:type I restriction endonuclease subunit R [Sodalinema gerasimenkoae]